MNLKKKEEVLTFLRKYRKECATIPSIGQRDTIAGVSCILHRPSVQTVHLPMLIVLHGGSWVGVDAVVIDSLCETLADRVPAMVVNMNYTKVDEKPFPNSMEEVCSLLSYFKNHSEEFGINSDKIAICGQSAGAHIVAGACLMAKDKGLSVARQILVYPFVDWSGIVDNPMVEYGIAGMDYDDVLDLFFPGQDLSSAYLSPLAADEKQLKGIAAADIIVCGQDKLREHGVAYYTKLKSLGIESTLKEYEQAIHGFLEVNRPDFIWENPGKNEEQAKYAKECENYIIDILKNL